MNGLFHSDNDLMVRASLCTVESYYMHPQRSRRQQGFRLVRCRRYIQIRCLGLVLHFVACGLIAVMTISVV